ncbi:MAG: DUF2299 family protein [Dehalococcoidia bacterium]|nr:DUF2299 family protein [Dehalococcoidia bacterium]
MRQNNPTINPSANEIRAQIQTWLMEEGWRIRPESVPDAEWFISGESEAGVRIGVGQRRGSADQIIAQGSVTTNQTHQQQIAQLSTEERNDFLWDMRFRLLNMGVEFSGITDTPQEIRISQRIYYDGLTKDHFLQRVSQVRNGVLAVIWMVARRLAQPPPERTVGFRRPEGA